jgi:hypothetical protein
MDWHKIETCKPPLPVGVELYYANMSSEYVIEPYRDCRRDLAYWDGETFRELNTGHCCFETWRKREQLPTHWRELPAAPEVD